MMIAGEGLHQLPNSLVNNSMANTDRGRKPIKRGAGRRMVDGKNFRLADEVRYILRRAAEHDGRVVTIGQFVLFFTETGDAWLLAPSDQLAAPLARDGDPEPFDIEENETTFTIDWKGHYRIEGATFVYRDRETGRLATRSCPWEWCNSRRVTAFTGIGRAGQLAIAGRLTAGSSLNGAMVSRVM
jgi:hypothetical protein